LDALGDVLSARSFALGLLWGGLAVLLSPPLARFTRRNLVDMGGLAFGLAAFLALRGWGGSAVAPWGTAVALAVLVAGGHAINHLELRMSARVPRAAIAPLLALAPGAVLLAITVPIKDPAWVPYAIAFTVPVVGGLLHDFDRVHSARSAPFLLLFISVLGAYLTVPSTDLMLVLLGVSVTLALLSFPQPLASFGPAGSAAVAGVFCWIAVVEAGSQPGSAVGAIGALGLMLAEPIGRRFRKKLTGTGKTSHRRRRRTRDLAARFGDKWIMVVGTSAVCQLALALYASRVAGLEQTVFMALLSLTPALTVAVFAVAEIVPAEEAEPRRRSHRDLPPWRQTPPRRREAW
jgi:hypothetical protein